MSSPVTPGSVGSPSKKERRDSIMTDGQYQQLQELDDIKIKTMYQMVEDVEISTGGIAVAKKFLYLSNKQAASFNTTNMDNVLQALELPESHFVIRLVPSLKGMAENRAHKERHGKFVEKSNLPPLLNEDDRNRTEAQLILFVKHCILPVAMQTRALILCGGANDCSLSMAVQKVMGPILERMGSACPFTVIGMTFSFEVHAKAHEANNTIAGQYAAESKTWSRRFGDIHSILISRGQEIADMQQCDMNSACTHMILFESINVETQKIESKPRQSFENTFIESLVQKLPSIVIQAQSIDANVKTLADICRRKIPLLLLDSRERWPLLTPEENPGLCANPVTALAQELSALQVPKEATGQTVPDKVALAERLLKEHLEALRKGEGGGCHEEWNASTLSFLRAIKDFKMYRRKNERPQRWMSLIDAIESEDEALKRNKGFAGVRNDHSDDIEEKGLADLYFELIQGSLVTTRVEQLKAYIKSREPAWDTGGVKDGDGEGSGAADEGQPSDPKTDQGKRWLAYYQEQAERIAKTGGRETRRNIDDWMAVYEILTSANCFSESIFDLKGISKIMSDVAKIDHLPDRHTREALTLIQHAWCNVDAYRSTASCYKVIAKLCYFLMLLIGIMVVAVGLVSSAEIEIWGYLIGSEVGKYSIFALALANAVVAGLASFMNPAMRWHHLRSSALQQESEIWGLRTRTGKYREDRTVSSRSVEKTFHQVLKSIEESTFQSADLRQTTFYSKSKTKWSQHGQNPDQRCCCWKSCSCGGRTRNAKTAIMPVGSKDNTHHPFDNHHSPLRPDEYLKFRLQPVLSFYRGRLPRYSRSRTFTKVSSIIGSIGGSILAVFDLAGYTVVLVMVLSAIVAWSEFLGTEKKLNRYSTVVSGLSQIELWWTSLPEVERLSTRNIDTLVQSVEGQIRKERQGWRATSQSTKKLTEAIATSKGETGVTISAAVEPGDGGGKTASRRSSNSVLL